jgi:hypothetical protein
MPELDHTMTLEERQDIMDALRTSWDAFNQRAEQPEIAWFEGLIRYLDGLFDKRVSRVKIWISLNISRFADHQSTLDTLFRDFDTMVVDIRTSLKLCGMQCLHCQLTCIQHSHHELSHDCMTSHQCPHLCRFAEDHVLEEVCGLP